MTIKIDYSRDKLLPEFSIRTLQDRYMIPGEKSPQDAFARAAMFFADDDAHAQRLYDYVSKQWFMFSTPILSNGGTSRGLPISCFLNFVPDSLEGLANHFEENVFLTSRGGGIGSYFGEVRGKGESTSNGSESTGIIPHCKVDDSQMLAYSQGITRRGSEAVYVTVHHPEIEEFLDIRKPTGDANRRCTNLHHGVVISRKFIDLIEYCADNPGADDTWELISPKTGEVVGHASAVAIWIKMLQNRVELGEPYMIFIDDINDALPQHLKDLGLRVYHSNLCVEITLPTSPDRTAVCCLSSVNVEEFDQWKDNKDFIPDLMRMLDNVLQDFIDNAPPQMWRAVNSAIGERSVGLGAMGFHSYLQRHNLPMDSMGAAAANILMFEHIKSEAERADRILMEERGPCPDSANSAKPMRFSHKLAIAPNASSSIICDNTSPSIEPISSNIVIQKTKSGSHILKNPYLEYCLQEIGMNTEDVWKDILEHQGSVQHLDFLDDWDKNVFKTGIEIDQRVLLRLANARGKFICQAQSLNLFVTPEVNKKYLHELHLMAAKSPHIKTLYYLRSRAISRPSAAKLTQKIELGEECFACEG